jgi:hypothetical protein
MRQYKIKLLYVSIILKVIHLIKCVDISFPFIYKYCSIVWIHHNLFFHACADGHFGCSSFCYYKLIYKHAGTHTHTHICMEFCFHFS